MGSNIKSLVALLIFAGLLGGAYLASQKYGLFDTATQLAGYEESVANLEREALVLLDQINRVNFSDDVFRRTEYKSLKSIRVELPKPVLSRPDPFVGL